MSDAQHRDSLHAGPRLVVRFVGRLLVVLVMLGGTGACARPQPVLSEPPPGPAEVARHRAALAGVQVDNRTAHRLTISYRPAATHGGAISVGVAEPGQRADMAPVPAGEPIVFAARTPAGTILEMAPRTLEVDQEWIWIVPRDAVFRQHPQQ
jgi:hypothetical protein